MAGLLREFLIVLVPVITPEWIREFTYFPFSILTDHIYSFMITGEVIKWTAIILLDDDGHKSRVTCDGTGSKCQPGPVIRFKTGNEEFAEIPESRFIYPF